MAFPVTCPSCGKAFQLATDIYERKVAGKVVSIKCKQCQSGIRVDATVPGQLKVLGTTPAAAGTDSRRPPAPSIHEEPVPMRARQPTLLGMTAPSSPSSTGSEPADGAGPLWAVDSGGAGEDRELNDEQIAREISTGKLAPNTLVWREGFGDWLEIASVPQLAQHLPGAKKPAGLPPRVAAKSAPINPAPAAKPASAPINPSPAAKSAPLNPAAAKPAAAVPKVAPRAAPLAAKAAAPVPKAGEPRPPQRSSPLMDSPQPLKVDLGLEEDDESTMIYRAPTDLVAQLTAEEKPAAPPPAAGRPAIAKQTPAPKAAPAPKAPPPPPAPPPLAAAPPLPAAPPPRAAPPLPAKAAPAPPPLPSLPAEAPEPTFSDPMPAPAISAEPEPPLQSAQPFPVLSAQPIAARPLDPSIPIKGLEFPPAPRVPQGALPPQAAAPFGAPTPGVTPTNAPPGMGMLAPNPFATMPTTTDLEFPAQRSKVPYVVAALLGVAAVGGIVAVFMTSKAPPPPVPVPVAVPTEKSASPVPAAQTATAPAETATAAPAPDPVANPSGTPGATASGNFSQMFAAGVESAAKTGGPVAANAPFDAEAAKKAVLAQLTRVAACKEAGSPLGQTSAAITFEPSGKVSGVTVGAPFAGTSTGTCMVTAFKEVQVAPFTGLPATVSQAVSLR